jgi:hypothetical protein
MDFQAWSLIARRLGRDIIVFFSILEERISLISQLAQDKVTSLYREFGLT